LRRGFFSKFEEKEDEEVEKGNRENWGGRRDSTGQQHVSMVRVKPRLLARGRNHAKESKDWKPGKKYAFRGIKSTRASPGTGTWDCARAHGH